MFPHILSKLRHSLHSLYSSTEGSVIMFVGLGFFMLLAATGAAIDMSRIQSAQSKLSNALDAAGLAAGAKAHSSDTESVVQNYLQANFPAGYMDTTITDVDVDVNDDNTVITLAATALVNMQVMQVFGIDTVEISATSEITRQNRGMELVMVLDITGSMYTNDKIGSLRTAANDLVDILFGSKDTIENLWIGIVPYVTAVNIGASRTAWLRDYNPGLYPSNYPATATKWKGCVEARSQWPETGGLDISDAPPDGAFPETLFPMYFWEDNNTDNNWITSSGSVSLNQNAGYTDTGARGPNIACGEPITPMISDKAALHTA